MQNIELGDCLDVMRTMEDNCVSAIITDPPYGLSFMNKGWDHTVPGVEYWQEMLRISKPGAHLLAMGGTRTFHRLTCAIEDAGWEIRDCLMWIYGSGFPKSHNHFGIEGYGTAVKPAYEPIIMAMKPCDGTFKQNAEKWGQAGINIDGCRIGTDTILTNGMGSMATACPNVPKSVDFVGKCHIGRWPANVIFDEEAADTLDEQSGILSGPKKERVERKGEGASRFFYCAKASSSERNEGLDCLPIGQTIGGGGINNTEDNVCGKYGSIKAAAKNYHPTVKPLKLMEYLIKLIMPPDNGILLDPFAGSGTTILAAKRLGFSAVGIEKEEEYVKIAKARLNAEKQ
jgi:site-specific DNA-methyltransferase (adenine-specific)